MDVMIKQNVHPLTTQGNVARALDNSTYHRHSHRTVQDSLPYSKALCSNINVGDNNFSIDMDDDKNPWTLVSHRKRKNSRSQPSHSRFKTAY